MSDNPRSLPQAPNSETFAPRLSTSTLRQRLKDETYAAIGKTSFPWQLDVAEVLCNCKDVSCIARTDKGKTLAFVMPYFVDPQVLIWIFSPLNYVQQHQERTFGDWKLPACAVNTTQILSGKYRVIITSPERLLKYNKLRLIIIQLGAANWNNIVIVDECHCICISTTWDPILCGNGNSNLFDAGTGSIIAPVPEGIQIHQRGVLEAEFILLLRELTCTSEEFADQIEIYHALQSQQRSRDAISGILSWLSCPRSR